jgi:hypothetical protein
MLVKPQGKGPCRVVVGIPRVGELDSNGGKFLARISRCIHEGFLSNALLLSKHHLDLDNQVEISTSSVFALIRRLRQPEN